MTKTALIAGSTGLVGRQLLQLLLDSSDYHQVVALTRHDLPPHAKLLQLKTDFDKLSEHPEVKADDVFCCLGTTMAKAGSKENFYKVDFFYPYLVAKTAHARGAKRFLLISALGADKQSTIYYNRVKGEIEAAIKSVGYDTVHIFRPSLLLGSREEKRAGEDAAKFLYRTLGFLIPARFKAIDAAKVARAMYTLAQSDAAGVHVHESKALQQY